MSLAQLAWKNISGNTFRSVVVSLCALLVAAFVLFTTLVMRGAETSLRLAINRLGADIVVVPEGSEAKIEPVTEPYTTDSAIEPLWSMQTITVQLFERCARE